MFAFSRIYRKQFAASTSQHPSWSAALGKRSWSVALGKCLNKMKSDSSVAADVESAMATSLNMAVEVAEIEALESGAAEIEAHEQLR